MRNTAMRLSWLILVGALYLVAAKNLYSLQRRATADELQIRLPLFAQVAMAVGDRYLAANLAGFRALLASTEAMQAENFHVLGRVQVDIAWLNPAHEDNYYIAAAILPWSGEVDAAQDVLRRAIDARPLDWQPIFYYAFDLYHFKRDPLSAAKWLHFAAQRATIENDRLALLNLAALWYEKGYSPNVAAGVLQSMANATKPGGFKNYLLARAERQRAVSDLQRAAQNYLERHGVPIRSLDDLLQAGLIKSIPKDPFGFGYTVNAAGEPIVLNAPQRKPQ